MKPRLRWLTLLVPIALFAWAYQATLWRPKLVVTLPPPGPNFFDDDSSLLVSPNGERVAWAVSEYVKTGRAAGVYDVAAERMVWQKSLTEGDWMMPLAFSPDSRLMAASLHQYNSKRSAHLLIVVDLATGKTRTLQSFRETSPSSLQSAVFSSPRELIISTDRGVMNIDTTTARVTRQWKFALLKAGLGSNVFESRVSADATTALSLSVTNLKNAVTLYDLKSGEPRATWKYQNNPSDPLLSPDGKLWVMWEQKASQPAALPSIYDARTGKKLWNPPAGTLWIWSADGQRILLATNGSLSIVDARTGREIERHPGGKTSKGMALSPSGDHVYTLEDNGKLWRWRLR